MNDEDVDRIVAAYTAEPVIETPFGTMTGQPTPEGSKIAYAGYTMPYAGDTVHILGLAWGHGTLFIHTEEHGTTGVKVPYELTRPVECARDADDDADDDGCPLHVKTATQTSLDAWGLSRWTRSHPAPSAGSRRPSASSRTASGG